MGYISVTLMVMKTQMGYISVTLMVMKTQMGYISMTLMVTENQKRKARCRAGLCWLL